MGLRLSEQEYADLMRRRGLSRCAAPAPSGVTLAKLDGSELTKIQGATARAFCADEIDAFPAAAKPEKRSKYGNRRVEIDGLKFDSQHEADFYFETLLPAWKCGAYQLLARQVPFDLPGGIKYIADFLTVGVDGYVNVIDAKSAATRKNRVYINKKKQMKACWGIEILEV